MKNINNYGDENDTCAKFGNVEELANKIYLMIIMFIHGLI